MGYAEVAMDGAISTPKVNRAHSVLPAAARTDGMPRRWSNQSRLLTEGGKMSFSKSSLSQSKSESTVRSTLPQDNAMFAEVRWKKVLDDPSLRRLLRYGHRTETTTSLLKQLEEDV
jgi:hypothetical protein